MHSLLETARRTYNRPAACTLLYVSAPAEVTRSQASAHGRVRRSTREPTQQRARAARSIADGKAPEQVRATGAGSAMHSLLERSDGRCLKLIAIVTED